MLLIGLFVIIAGSAIAFVTLNNDENPGALVNSFDDSTAFTLDYPDQWDYRIPAANTFLLAPLPVLDDLEAGPSVTVLRTNRFEAGGDTGDDILTTFLARNALTGDDSNWTQIDAGLTAQIGGQNAVGIEISGNDDPEGEPLRTQIFVTLSENNMVYFVFLSAPETLWDDFVDTLTAMRDSVEILE